MTAVMKIHGVPYRNDAEIEKAVRELAAEISILPEDNDTREGMAQHVGELLAALPDEKASALLQLIAGVSAVDIEALDNAEPRGEDDDEPTGVTLNGNEEVPICPMCLGAGVLATEPPQDPTAERCPACEGYGNVYTGSRVDGHTTRSCPTCNGNGYIAKTPDIPLPPPARRAAAAPAWPDAQWNPTTQQWDAPPGVEPPWEGATWDGMEGKYI